MINVLFYYDYILYDATEIHKIIIVISLKPAKKINKRSSQSNDFRIGRYIIRYRQSRSRFDAPLANN